ncbi:hypothetical protein CR152_29510 [Massilia violaceinigra]|uniref:Uncharacterized protein n=1 Tax=Massilia violaceinigra TaxID=2045208 RepID=A0A2D2DT97_9BURK|nr:hypothetical protein [Massilia violaceinigra]ATQ78186.1 hypothetical protein CR152_29510 [Massilia violaceinigra]
MTPAEDTIDIDDASEGMVLAQDLRDAGGGVLLPAGATLSASSLASLRRRGIEQIQVVGAAPPVDEAAVRAERERQCARLEHLFRRSLSGAPASASAVLYERLLAYRRSC